MFGQMTFIIDIDGTLCPIKAKHERYEDLVPYADMIKDCIKITEQKLSCIPQEI